MSDLIAYKSNALVEASYKLTLQEQRFLLLCIGRLKSGADAESPKLQKTMTITAAEYFDSFPDMGRKNAEVQLQEAIDRLWDRSIILKDDEKREEFRWIQYRAQYAKGEARAQITFSDAVMPYLTQLQGQFTRVVIKNISRLSRSYSIRIYELLQQFRSTGERMGEASRSHYMARMQTLRLDGFLLRPLLSLFSSLILCGLLMLFGFSASGTIEVGVLYAFISYLGRLNEPLIELTTQQAMLQQAVVAGERVFELMDGPRQQYGNDDRPLQSGTIEVDNVSFAYRDDNLVLKNINLSVPSRNFVALVGHTGSGKSTLASLLMGYYPLTEGEIRLDGRPLSSLSHSALRQGVAMVQQDPVVLADTFLANVTLGRDISEERVWQALETVQLAELARSMSDGIYTPLGEQGNNLSVGQKQLLALARVLVETPQILILDEATASIDSGTEQAIQHALAAVREHTTLVVIAHRLSTIVDADTILVLHRGQAVEQGTHQQLLAAQGRYWQMYQLQLAGEELAASVREEESLSA